MNRFKNASIFLTLILSVGCESQGKAIGYIIKDGAVYYETISNTETGGLNINLERRSRKTNADPMTFEVLDFDHWGKDKDRGYFKGSPVEGSDSSSFRAINSYFAADKTHVWQGSSTMTGPVIDADGSTFKIIGRNYANDKAAVYFTRQPAWRFIPCDLSTFEAVETESNIPAYAVDSQCAYVDGTKIPISSRQNFELLGGSYSKDGVGVYWGSRKLEGVDVESFYVPEGMRFGRDISGCWNGTRPKPCIEN